MADVQAIKAKIQEMKKLRDENYLGETEKIRESKAKSRQKLKENYYAY